MLSLLVICKSWNIEGAACNPFFTFNSPLGYLFYYTLFFFFFNGLYISNIYTFVCLDLYRSKKKMQKKLSVHNSSLTSCYIFVKRSFSIYRDFPLAG